MSAFFTLCDALLRIPAAETLFSGKNKSLERRFEFGSILASLAVHDYYSGLGGKLRKSLISAVAHVAAALGLLVWANQASADLQVQTFSGNDCSGVFGQGFDNCSFNNSPIVIKFEAGGLVEINGFFPSIDGSEFNFTPALSGILTSGQWAYTPDDADDPLLRYWVAKAGNGFNLFWDGTSDPTSATVQFSNQWFTPDEAGLSHLSFYDTRDGFLVSGPSSLMLVGLALAVLAFAPTLAVRRRA